MVLQDQMREEFNAVGRVLPDAGAKTRRAGTGEMSK